MRNCKNRNELFSGPIENRGECVSKCDNAIDCVSFEWWGEFNPYKNASANYCKLSSSCTYDLSKASSPPNPADLYVKRKAQFSIQVKVL